MAHYHSGRTRSHSQTYGKAFGIGIGLNVTDNIVEVVYGLMIDSSALLVDI